MTENPAVIFPGDRVKFLGIPEWLIHDLPGSEQLEMLGFVGSSAIVEKIDAYGYFWIGFGCTKDVEDSAEYSGHSFAITREYIELDKPGD